MLMTLADSIVNPQKLGELGLTVKDGVTAVLSVFLEGPFRPKAVAKHSRHSYETRSLLFTEFVRSAVRPCVAVSLKLPKPEAPRLQGYVEGEYVYVSAPLGGALQTLSVQRGAQVVPGAPLFVLENGLEKAAQDEAERRLNQARAQLEDVKKGLRPAEVESIEAQLKQARIAASFSEKEFTREQDLSKTGANTTQELDRARSAFDEDRQRVAQLEAQLIYSQLGARADQVSAAEANVKRSTPPSPKRPGRFRKNSKAPHRPASSLTPFIARRWVAAGRPVVALLPAQNRKVRTFVPNFSWVQFRWAKPFESASTAWPRRSMEGQLYLPSGRVHSSGYYSRESREKLVFMVEIVFEPEVGAS